MSERKTKLNAKRAYAFHKAAEEAGYPRSRVIEHLDGTVEVIAEQLPASEFSSNSDSWDEVLK